MYVKLPCPSCGKNLKVSQEHLGQKARCPHCKNQITLPASAPNQEAGVDWQSIVSSPAEAQTKTAERKVPKPTVGQPTTSARFTGGTDVSMLWSSLFGLVATVVTLGVLFPFQRFYLSAVLTDRGWVPYAETFLFFWAIAFLVLKARRIRQQRDAMLYDLLPTEIGDEINPENVDRFVEHIQGIAGESRESILVNRVLRGLEHFRFRQNNAEVAGILASQSNIDANAVASSYSIVKVCNWAIPILGFIGTVIGIGDAVAGLGGSMAGADLNALKEQLGTITSGLGVAFDTTLVALVMSLIISFPASALQKNEEDLLNEIEDYCNENLILRLREPDAPGKGLPTDAQQTLQHALAAQKAILDMSEQNLKQLVEHFGKGITTLTEKSEAAARAVLASQQQATNAHREHLAALERGLSSLNNVLESLGQEKVIVEVQRPARRRWTLFGRANDGVQSRG